MSTPAPRSICAIDPGTSESAYVVWSGSGIDCAMCRPNDEVLEIFRSGQFDDCRTLGIEMVAHYGTGMPAGKEVFETCVWIGRFMEASAGKLGTLRPRLVYRKDIKMHLCGSMRAKDGNVRQSIIDRFGGKDKAVGKKASPGPLYGVSGHCWQALAVALYVQDNPL